MIVSATAASANPNRELPAALPPKAQPAKQAELVRDSAALAQEKKPADITPTQASAALAEVNQSLQMASIGVRFEFDKDAHTMITKVVDVHTGEMIRQMPTEEVVRISKALGQLQGLLVSEKV